MAARVPALRLAKRGAKRSPGRKSTPAGTLRELPVTSLGRGQERKRTPRGLQRGLISCRNGSKKLHAPKPRAGLRSLSASEGRTTEGDSAATPVPGHSSPTRQAKGPCAGPAAESRPANASIPWSDASGRARSGCRGRTGVRSTPSRNTVRSDYRSSRREVGPEVRGWNQSAETAQPTRRDRQLAIQDNPGSPQAHVDIPIRSMRSDG